MCISKYLKPQPAVTFTKKIKMLSVAILRPKSLGCFCEEKVHTFVCVTNLVDILLPHYCTVLLLNYVICYVIELCEEFFFLSGYVLIIYYLSPFT